MLRDENGSETERIDLTQHKAEDKSVEGTGALLHELMASKGYARRLAAEAPVEDKTEV